jgi:hypothetical protein
MLKMQARTTVGVYPQDRRIYAVLVTSDGSNDSLVTFTDGDESFDIFVTATGAGRSFIMHLEEGVGASNFRISSISAGTPKCTAFYN